MRCLFVSVEWDGYKMRSYVDLGTGVEGNLLPEATNVCVYDHLGKLKLENLDVRINCNVKFN